MDAQAHGQLHSPLPPQASSKLPHGVEHPEPSPYGALGVIFVRQGVAEVDQQAIAEILRDMALKAGDHLGAAILVGAHNLPQLFGVKLRRERGRADQVTEEHSELAAFCLWSRWCSRGR